MPHESCLADRSEVVCATDCTIVPVGLKRAIVRDHITQSAWAIDDLGAAILLACRECLPLEQHRETLARAFPDHREQLLGRLHELLTNRLLLRGDGIRFAARQTSTAPARRIDFLGIVTADRPKALRRCLSSYLESLQQFDHGCRVLVLDDSRSETCQASTATAVGLSHSTGDVTYLGRTGRIAFSARLARAGLDPDLVRLAIFGLNDSYCSTGANRNLALLKTVGSLILCSDDDVDCQWNCSSELTGATSICHDGNVALETRFFPDRSSVQQCLESTCADIVGAHERLLGATASDIVARFPQDTCLIGSPSRFVTDVIRGRGSVPITLTGVAGDSGMPTGALFLTARDQTRERFLCTESEYQRNRRCREIIRQVPVFTVAETGSVMTTTLTGLDNRALLPPFLPSFRSQDELFGYTLSRLYEHRYLGYIPLALLHTPSPGREYEALRTRRTVAHIVMGFMSAVHIPSAMADPAGRLKTLGEGITSYANLSLPAFEEALWQVLSEQVQRQIIGYKELLSQHGDNPAYWARDLRQYIDCLAEFSARPDFLSPIDLPLNTSQEMVLDEVRHIVGTYGQLLLQWPDMVAASARINAAQSLD
jgi:hypothetical protein